MCRWGGVEGADQELSFEHTIVTRPIRCIKGNRVDSWIFESEVQGRCLSWVYVHE